MSTTTIRRAAYERLSWFVYDPQPVIVWPGIESNPPGTGMWLEPQLFPNEPEDVAWNDDACVDTKGFLQIKVHYRPGEGLPNPVNLADALIVFFPKGSALGPVSVSQRAWQGPPVED